MKRRPVIHPAANSTLAALLHQAATGALRQPLIIDRTAVKR